MNSEALQKVSATSTAKSFVTFIAHLQNAPQHYVHLDKFSEVLRSGDRKGLVIYSHPATVLESALLRQEDYAKRLDAWVSEARDVLSVVRPLRSRVVIFEQTTPQDKNALSIFRENFSNHTPPTELTARKSCGLSTLQAIAGFAIYQHPEVTRYIAELQASSLAPPPEFVPAPDRHTLLTELEQQRRNENELESLRSSQQETEIVHAHLLEQLTELQTEFEHVARKRTEAQKKLNEVRQELNLVYASTSWRLSAPLRAVMRLVRR